RHPGNQRVQRNRARVVANLLFSSSVLGLLAFAFWPRLTSPLNHMGSVLPSSVAGWLLLIIACLCTLIFPTIVFGALTVGLAQARTDPEWRRLLLLTSHFDEAWQLLGRVTGLSDPFRRDASHLRLRQRWKEFTYELRISDRLRFPSL